MLVTFIYPAHRAGATSTTSRYDATPFFFSMIKNHTSQFYKFEYDISYLPQALRPKKISRGNVDKTVKQFHECLKLPIYIEPAWEL